MKKCFYCGDEIEETNVLGFCDVCGIKVWGPKMLNAIRKNMEDARENGNLELGNVSEMDMSISPGKQRF